MGDCDNPEVQQRRNMDLPSGWPGVASGFQKARETPKATEGSPARTTQVQAHDPARRILRKTSDATGRHRQRRERTCIVDRLLGNRGTAVFSGLPLSSIKEFQFQVRPYDWVEFKNVSLQPGRATIVRVVSSVDSTNAEK